MKTRKNGKKSITRTLMVGATCMALVGLWAVLAVPVTAWAGKPNEAGEHDPPHGGDDPEPGDDVHIFKDMPLCITFTNLSQIDPSVDPLCASGSGITAFAGRRRTITLSIHKNTTNPSLSLILGNPLTADTTGPDVDPDPDNDGGFFAGGEVPLPTLGGNEGGNGQISEPQLQVGIGVNVKDIEETTTIETGARLRFKDDLGQEYQLFWGSGTLPGGFLRGHKDAPDVSVTRNNNDAGKRNWSVTTTEDFAAERPGAHTAFLWWVDSPHGPRDYCGAYDVLFAYDAEQE